MRGRIMGLPARLRIAKGVPMGLSKRLVTSAAVLAFALLAVEADAQHRGGGGHGGVAPMRGGGGGSRSSAPRPVFSPAARVVPRMGGSRSIAPRFAAPRFGPSRFGPSRVVTRPVYGGRSFGVTRSGIASRAVISRGGFVARRPFVGHAFAPRFIGPRIIVAPHRFARPFYAFRPRFSLGFGLWVGFPVAYPYYYDYPYGYPYAPYPYANGYPYPYAGASYGYPASGYPASGYPASSYPASGYPAGTYATPSDPQAYPASGSIDAQRGQDAGGVSFEITPNTARVIVDGTEVGSVAEFSPTATPLTLTLGRHHIELRAAGYQTMAFDAEIVAGQVIPYRGELQPQR